MRYPLRRFRATAFTVLAVVAIACSNPGADPDEGAGTADGTDEAGEDGAATDDGDAAASDAEPVTLSLVSSFPRDAREHAGFWLFADLLEENAPWITLDYRGGPDIMDPLQLVESVSSGAIDMATLPEAFYVQQAPVAELFKFSPYTPMEERENGLFDLYSQFHEEDLNVHYTGKVFAGAPYVLFTKDQIDSPDLSGLTIRTSSAQAAVVQSLGGEVVNIPAGEVYTALERGTVDGFGWASVGIEANSWQDVVSYEIEPRFGEATIPVVINLDVWEGLEPATQEAITQTMIEAEPEVVDLYQQLAIEEQQAFREAGVEVIRFEGEEGIQFLEGHYVGGYEAIGYDDIVAQYPIAGEIRDIYEERYGGDWSQAVPGDMYLSDVEG